MQILDNSESTQEKYLQPGRMTGYFPEEIVDEVRKKVDKICKRNKNIKPYEALASIVYKDFLINTQVKGLFNKGLIKKEKFNRSVQEIYGSKYMTGCTDYAMVYSTLARQLGMPTTFIATTEAKTAGKSTGKNKGTFVGHAFCEVYDKETNSWVLVDPTNNKVQRDYDPNNFKLTSHKVYGSKNYIPYFRDSDPSQILEGIEPENRTKKYIEFQMSETEKVINGKDAGIAKIEPISKSELKEYKKSLKIESKVPAYNYNKEQHKINGENEQLKKKHSEVMKNDSQITRE